MPDVVLAAFFILGAVMLLFPLAIYRMPGGAIYTQEFVNRFTTRVMSRALGVLFMMLCLGAWSSAGRSAYPGLPGRFFTALTIAFGFVWVSALVLGLATWLSPRAKAWAESLSTDRISRRQDRLELGIAASVFLCFTIWAALPMVTQ